MKKLIPPAIVFIFVLLFAATAFAEEINVTVDGVRVDFDGQAPAVVGGRVLVPVRGVFEALGWGVTWIPEVQTVMLSQLVQQGDFPVEMQINVTVGAEYFAVVYIGVGDFARYHGVGVTTREEPLEVPAQIIGGRTMLPIRALIESMGCSVDWDSTTQTVVITTHAGTIEPEDAPPEDEPLPPEPAYLSFTPVTGRDMMERIAVGINIGNTMESSGFLEEIIQCPVTELETTWGNARIEQWHFEAIALKGFDSVRLPINWTTRMDEDFVIDERWLDRVQEVVDWALDEGLYVIINTHHERDLYDPMYYGPFEDAERWLLSVWAQVSERFKYYPERLIFEPMNEPRPGLDGWYWCDERFAREIRVLAENSRRLNEAVLEVIRSSGGYNDRRVVMLATFQGRVDPRFFTPPENDPYIMLGGFLYPRDDARELQDLQEIRTALEQGIAMVVKETSPYGMDAEDALKWAEEIYPQLAELGVPVFWWNRSAGFAPYELFWRNAGTWNYPLVDVLFAAYDRTPGPSLPPAPVEFPHEIATSISQTNFTTWTQGASFGTRVGYVAIPAHILYAADFVIVEFTGRALYGDFSFTRWHPAPWTRFDRDDPRITVEPGRIIFDLRGTEGNDFGFAVWDERDVERITRIYLALV